MCSVSNYVPRYRKKRDILAKREQEFIRVLQRGESPEQVVEAAEEVRAAQIRVVNAERARIPGYSAEDSRLANLEAQYHRWAIMPVEDIIAAYQRKLPKRTPPEPVSP
jgi:chromatin segregation and condensation protein Rec8/ScpA/Scc1 (kleisin family)